MSTQGASKDQLVATIAKLHESGAYSDLKIVCGSETYNVHKAIICPQSTFFKIACRPNAFQEGRTGVIEIPVSSGRDAAFYKNPIAIEEFDWDLDVETATSVKLMIHYLYHHDYLEQADSVPRVFWSTTEHLGQGILAQHSRMYAMGEKYGVPGLKALAATRYKEMSWKTDLGLTAAIMIAFKGTHDQDTRLRSTVLSQLDALREIFKGYPDVQKMISETPEIAHELYRKVLEREFGSG
ncbi:hypothetical protein D6D02_02574 [Aureobasidium pullulans]|nr:hypothetical protein D6D03_02574 [Aureobasidium pullulans]THY18919.1 hypothetical protein D6D02_02574 [Aureobasidium pullulans]